MAIEFNATKIATQTTSISEGAITQTPAQKLASLLGGASLTISDGSLSDLEALVSRLKNEQEKSKFSMLLTSLGSISDSLSSAQKAALDEGIKYSEQLDTLNKSLNSLANTLASDQAAAAIMEKKIKSLEEQIEAARKDGKEHNKLVQEQKELRKELDAKNKVIEETQGKIAEAKNALSEVSGKISAILSSIDNNTLKTIANKIADIAKPEETESNAEREKKAAKEEATDLFAAIRKSLDDMSRELADTIERNIETHV